MMLFSLYLGWISVLHLGTNDSGEVNASERTQYRYAPFFCFMNMKGMHQCVNLCILAKSSSSLKAFHALRVCFPFYPERNFRCIVPSALQYS